MKAFLILEDGTVFTGTSIGSTKEVISEIVFQYFHDWLSGGFDRSFLCRTGGSNDVSADWKLWQLHRIWSPHSHGRTDYIVRELSRIPSNFRCQGTIQDFLDKNMIFRVSQELIQER